MKSRQLRIASFLITFFLIVAGCSHHPQYHVGDYLTPTGAYDSSHIIKIVAVSGTSHTVFTHFMSDGRLIEAQDYQSRRISDIENGYNIVSTPSVDGTFSPEKYISQHQNNE